MKYGRIIYCKSFGMNSINLGDYAQTFAIDYIYEQMGIPKSDIIDIMYEEICSYNGEHVTLPMNAYCGYMKKTPLIPTSNKINPVFIGFHTISNKYFDNNNFWKHHSPIGCRDESTFLEMKKHNYNAFISGCMTILFPRRTQEPKTPRTFIIDAHHAVYNYIPKHIMDHAEFLSQEIEIDLTKGNVEAATNNEKKAREYYERLRNEATLVITSRLHCAAPCVAMGIPVILVKKSFDERFSWLDKYLPFYTPDKYDIIDWSPIALNIETEKKTILEMAISMLDDSHKQKYINEVHSLYNNRNREQICTPFFLKCFNMLMQKSPRLAMFIREKILSRFTIKS